ncbi:MAG: hypothetical protein ACODAQ_10250, partial [Phycisphaeraceae bacterium]
MSEDKALEILKRNGLDPQVVVEAVESASGRPFEQFILKPTGNNQDALFIMTEESGGGEGSAVASIYWYKNWISDTKLPKGEREWHTSGV